mmetsp:Transcript_91807/g.297049  ORF Transcript_91807/g.297049 Transcript_91807/m.297049 type:complete len:256 (-) Transcript_91807:65-832(-)
MPEYVSSSCGKWHILHCTPSRQPRLPRKNLQGVHLLWSCSRDPKLNNSPFGPLGHSNICDIVLMPGCFNLPTMTVLGARSNASESTEQMLDRHSDIIEPMELLSMKLELALPPPAFRAKASTGSTPEDAEAMSRRNLGTEALDLSNSSDGADRPTPGTTPTSPRSRFQSSSSVSLVSSMVNLLTHPPKEERFKSKEARACSYDSMSKSISSSCFSPAPPSRAASISSISGRRADTTGGEGPLHGRQWRRPVPGRQ